MQVRTYLTASRHLRHLPVAVALRQMHAHEVHENAVPRDWSLAQNPCGVAPALWEACDIAAPFSTLPVLTHFGSGCSIRLSAPCAGGQLSKRPSLHS